MPLPDGDVNGDGSAGLAFSIYSPEEGFSEPAFGSPELLPPSTRATVATATARPT